MSFREFNSKMYLNGNYIVKTSSYGNVFFSVSKRALRIGEELKSEFPDSIDLKISNRCSHGCPFCHESSTKDGKILDLKKTKEILSQLPKKPIEIAIGGGNVLECIDEVEDINEWLKKRGHRTRITITLDDLNTTGDSEKDNRIIKFLGGMEALGISVTKLKKDLPEKGTRGIGYKYKPGLLDLLDFGEHLSFGPQTVIHVIAGITPLKDIEWLVNSTSDPVLVLGYKQWGRAKDTKLPDMTGLKDFLRDLIRTTETRLTLGFDNLAIEQLGIKEMIGEDKWKGIYLGDEGTCSMYIDAVKGEFARTSRSPERVSWNDVKLLDYYASLNS